MQTQPIVFDRGQARELWRKYREHQHYSEPIDQEIERIYQLIAQGRTVIRAMASVVAAGMHVGGQYHNLPKLAICRADAEKVVWRTTARGGTFYADTNWQRNNAQPSRRVTLDGMWPGIHSGWPGGEALLPTIPLHLRPRRGLPNYHVLWEAEWRRQPPGDPMLLRRIGQADAWLVVAAWDLTPIEQAALATRLNG